MSKEKKQKALYIWQHMWFQLELLFIFGEHDQYFKVPSPRIIGCKFN